MSSVFCGAKGIVSLQKGYTINGCQLAETVTKGCQDKRILFHQGNTPTYKSLVSMADLRDCSFELADQLPPYSHDLAPFDYLFLIMNKHLAGNQQRSEDDVISAAEESFDQQDESL